MRLKRVFILVLGVVLGWSVVRLALVDSELVEPRDDKEAHQEQSHSGSEGTGAPLSGGLRIRAFDDDGAPVSSLLVSLEDQSRRLDSDGDGAFLFEGLPVYRDFEIELYIPCHRAMLLPVTALEPGELRDLGFVMLEALGTLNVLVKSMGEVVSGTRVVLKSVGGDENSSVHEQVSTCGPDGIAGFSCVREGFYIASVDDPRFAPASISFQFTSSERKVLELMPGTPRARRVVWADSGGVVEGAVVRLRWLNRRRNASFVCDGAGRFAFHAQDGDRIQVSLGMGHCSTSFESSVARLPAVLALDRCGSAEIQVFCDGVPQSREAVVQIETVAGLRVDRYSTSAGDDGNHRVVVDYLDPGSYRARAACKELCVSGWVEFSVTPGRIAMVTLRSQSASGKTRSLRVLDCEGNPIEGASVEVWIGGHSSYLPRLVFFSSSLGAVEIPIELYSEDAMVSATVGGGWEHSSSGAQILASCEEIVVKDECTVSALVEIPNGLPKELISVEYSSGDLLGVEFEQEQPGAFFASVQPGEFPIKVVLVVGGSPVGHWSIETAECSASHLEVEFDLSLWKRVRFHLRGSRQWQGMTFRVRVDDFLYATDVVDCWGEFILWLPQGSCDVAVFGSGTAGQRWTWSEIELDRNPNQLVELPLGDILATVVHPVGSQVEFGTVVELESRGFARVGQLDGSGRADFEGLSEGVYGVRFETRDGLVCLAEFSVGYDSNVLDLNVLELARHVVLLPDPAPRGGWELRSWCGGQWLLAGKANERFRICMNYERDLVLVADDERSVSGFADLGSGVGPSLRKTGMLTFSDPGSLVSGEFQSGESVLSLGRAQILGMIDLLAVPSGIWTFVMSDGLTDRIETIKVPPGRSVVVD